MQPVYVTATAQCLPGAPIANDRMADHIGRLSPEAERFGRLVRPILAANNRGRLVV